MPPSDSAPPVRRRQSDRSEATRQRLIEATLSCLETEGYAGTTISKIVERGAVSRGAHVHHFPSKAALIEAAARQLVRRVYVQLGRALLGLEDARDRLRTMVMSSWSTVFGTREHAILLELLLASRHDEELALMMQRLWTSGYQLIRVAAEHYFEPVEGEVDIPSLMVISQWMLRGMSLDRHLARDEALLQQMLELWCDLLATRIRPRPGVTTPPPRPPQGVLD